MIKKFVFKLLLFFIIVPSLVYASANSAAKIGDKYYDSLEEAIANASSNDIIMLTSDVVLNDTLLINKVINLNLNGNDISAPEMVFQVQGGTLNISGKGTIRETKPNYGAIVIKGSNDPDVNEYSVVNVGGDVTLEGWSGIFINHDQSKAYGVVVNLAGKVNAIDDVNGGSGIGVYVNGNIKDQNNCPVINILDGAKIVSSGNGLYIAGYSTFNIGKAYISGMQSGIGIKAGNLNINGATVECLGEDSTPTEGYNNGINSSGVAIQIESNSGYAGNMEINIKAGDFKSKNSNVIYEYIGKGNSSLVNSMDILGGTFVSNGSKDVFLFSDSFKDKHSAFIAGGKYSSDPSAYLKPGYTAVLDNNLFSVTKSTMKEVNSEGVSNDNAGNNYIGVVLIVIVLLMGLIYFNKVRIVNLLRKTKLIK